MLLELKGILSLEVLKDLLVGKQKLAEAGLKLLGLLLLLGEELLIPLVIRVLLVSVVLLSSC